jgi:phenylpropionate dioxygenase-like ring-hydroxylating dioxygenase large terminal subunit
LPKWILRPLKPLLQTLLQRFVLLKFLAQDIEMVESEQRNYMANPNRRYVEINPAIFAIQRLIVRQYEQFMQKSSQSRFQRNQESEKSISKSCAANHETELNQAKPIG